MATRSWQALHVLTFVVPSREFNVVTVDSTKFPLVQTESRNSTSLLSKHIAEARVVVDRRFQFGDITTEGQYLSKNLADRTASAAEHEQVMYPSNRSSTSSFNSSTFGSPWTIKNKSLADAQKLGSAISPPDIQKLTYIKQIPGNDSRPRRLIARQSGRVFAMNEV